MGNRTDLVKVVVGLDESEWHGKTAESLWAEPTTDGDYAIRNVPFFARDLSLEDVVRVEEDAGRLVVTGVARRAGHSTYRIFLSKGITLHDARFEEAWRPLDRLGCHYENADDHFIAVDVPPAGDIYLVYAALEAGEDEGVWDFEEGHCGHPLRDD